MKLAPYVRAFGIGAVSGMRSMTGPAAVRRHANGAGRYAVALLALGELAADKLPTVPARTSPPALLVRALAGGFAGAQLAGAGKGDRRAGALLGAAGAVAAAFLFIRLRSAVVRRTGLPDPIVALGEDTLAAGAAFALTAESGAH